MDRSTAELELARIVIDAETRNRIVYAKGIMLLLFFVALATAGYFHQQEEAKQVDTIKIEGGS